MQPYDYGLWIFAVVNVLLFGGFAVGFLRPRKTWEWRSLGVFAAFIVALFAEMYGFPLTIYILTTWLGARYPALNPFGHLEGHLIGALLNLPDWGKLLICQVGGFVMVGGFYIMSVAWKRIHDARGALVTDGIYARIRHPQYAGLFLIAVGMLIQWPTLATLLMFPALSFAYYRLALREERALEVTFGPAYRAYAGRVPRFWPRRIWWDGAESRRRATERTADVAGPAEGR